MDRENRNGKTVRLRLLQGGRESSPVIEILPNYVAAPSFPEGIAKGTLTELVGTVQTDWFLQFLAQHAEFRILWCERASDVLSDAAHVRGLNLTRMTFAYGANLCATITRALESGSYHVVILPSELAAAEKLEHFARLTEKARIFFFLLGHEKPALAAPITLQLEIHPGRNSREFEVEVLTRARETC
jgi:hypothetical protein